MDGVFTVENIAFGVFKHFQYRELRVLHFLLVLVLCQNEPLMRLIELLVLFAHNQIQQLLLQAFVSDHKVDQLHLRRQVRLVVWVSVPCRHIKLELFSVVYV